MKRRPVLLAGMAVLGTILLGELVFRIAAGERLLYRADPEIEYLPLPDQRVNSRGVDIRTNAWGMRSAPVSASKAGNAIRVLVIGDSVVFGHTNISHDDLATTRLSQTTLPDGRRIEALNVSATSWGPGNMLAWLDRFGALDADAIVLVMSSDDLEDDRTFSQPARDVYPQAPPVSALASWLWRRMTPDPAQTADADARTQGDALRSIPELLRRAALAPSGGCLIIHATLDELREPPPSEGQIRLQELAQEARIRVMTGRGFIDASSGYVDGTHLSPAGQRDLARAIAACLGAEETGPSR